MSSCLSAEQSRAAVTAYEEQCWLRQQQHPERVRRHLGAWTLDERTDLALLALAIQRVVQTLPELNARYQFSDEGDLLKTLIPSLHPCLAFQRGASARLSDHLAAWRAEPWDAETQPPFQARIIHIEQAVVLALALHPILDQSCQLAELTDMIRQAYRQLDVSKPPLAWTPLDVPEEAAAALPPPAAAANPILSAILEEFRAALEEPALTVGDNFFDFGGHSLLATRIIGKLQSRHGIVVRFNDFFEAPSAAALAARAQRGETVDPAPAAMAADDVLLAPLALAQGSLWRAYAAYGFGTIFNLPFALDFLDPVDEEAFRQAFADLLARHASLRTLFDERAGEARQRALPVAQLDGYPWFWSSAQSEGVTLADEAAYRFDLSRELPIRVRFLRAPNSGRQTLSLLVHHMAIDEWSLNVMMRELEQAYQARVSGKAPVWAEPAPAFHAFALRQAGQGVNAEHMDYWIRRLRGARKGLALPAAAGQPAMPAAASSKAGWLEFKPAPGALQALSAFAKRHDASLFSVIYTAIALALRKLGDLPEIVIGTSASGRTDPAFFDTVGYFTTMVAHRIAFDGRQALGGLLKDVAATINDSMAYADIPLELIQNALGMGPEDGLLFDVYIQVHANNALNGALPAPDGRRIRYRQIDADKRESMFGLQFEIMEDVLDGEKRLRLVVTYRSERYSTAQVEAICAALAQLFEAFGQADAGGYPVADLLG